MAFPLGVGPEKLETHWRSTLFVAWRHPWRCLRGGPVAWKIGTGSDGGPKVVGFFFGVFHEETLEILGIYSLHDIWDLVKKNSEVSKFPNVHSSVKKTWKK